mmetsp:Transcript_16614/g.35931  ORF Transcript_16614/g.35931 Transcript_16614/m.35931 type:complete len:775 (-) Transcript_16614:968-3292(-)
MACCGDEPEPQEGVVIKRKCRDVICLVFFIAFWAGMFIICGLAFAQGDYDRLVYGTDSYGFTCGKKTTFRNATLDLSNRKELYFLNPLALLNVLDIEFAKAVCVESCPKTPVCDYKSLPCTNGDMYRCPYYRFAEDNLYGKLPNVSDLSVSYYRMLPSATIPASNVTTKFLQGVGSLPWVSNWMNTYNISSTSATLNGYYLQLQSQFPGLGPCYPVFASTESYFHRCFPQFPPGITDGLIEIKDKVANALPANATKTFTDVWNDVEHRWARYVGDISKGFAIILVGGLAGGVVFSLVWMIILRYLAGFMAWITILLVNVACLGITLFSFSMAGMLGSNEFTNKINTVVEIESIEEEQWKWIGVGAAIVTGIVFLVTLLMLSRVKVAVACIKVASQAVGAMPSILLFPLLPFIFEAGLVVYWIFVTAELYSAGDLTATCRTSSNSVGLTLSSLKNISSDTWMNVLQGGSSTNSSCYSNLSGDELQAACGADPNCFVSYKWNSKLRWAFLYHFFGLLWTNQVIVGFSCVTIAGAVGSYYWHRGDSSRMPTFPVLVAMKNTLIYHMGSICFGAFLVAVIQFIRFLLDYLDRKTRELQAQNKFAEWAMCCVKCCMWCLEKIVMFINKNAYIMVGVKGTSYCVSAGRAVALIVQNALRLITVNFVGDILIFLGKVGVAAGCGLIAFGMSEISYYNDPTKYPDTYLASPVLCVAISVITGFVVAQIFFSVYDMAIDTIILAFCEDCESNGGNPRYAPPLLMEAMGMAATSKVAPAPAPAK